MRNFKFIWLTGLVLLLIFGCAEAFVGLKGYHIIVYDLQAAEKLRSHIQQEHKEEHYHWHVFITEEELKHLIENREVIVMGE